MLYPAISLFKFTFKTHAIFRRFTPLIATTLPGNQKQPQMRLFLTPWVQKEFSINLYFSPSAGGSQGATETNDLPHLETTQSVLRS